MTKKIGVTNPVQPVTKNEQDPEHILSIIGLALVMFMPPIGVVVSAIALGRSKKRGYQNTLALAGVIINALVTLMYVLMIAVMMIIIVKFDNPENRYILESIDSSVDKVYVD